MRTKKLVLLAIIIAIVFAGCSKSETPVKETPSTAPTSAPSVGGDVPTYSGSKVYTASIFYSQVLGIPTEGVTVEVYQVENAKVGDILSWYKEKMSDYEIVQDRAIGTVNTPQGSIEWGGVLFKKGNEAVGIWAMSGSAVEGKSTIYYIVKGPADKLFGESEPEIEQLPTSDQASGEEPVPRYPEAIMINYYKDTSSPMELSIQIDYGTKDDAAKVTSWYKQELQSEGWMLEEESSDDAGYRLYFSKGSEYLDIYVIKPTETSAYTEIDLNYAKRGLPSQDVVSGEEPLKRYPGSVMLEYTTTTFGGAKMTTITYGTNDDPKEVFNWYSNEFESGGWQTGSSSSDESFSIYASKGSTVVQLEISRNAYTEILLTYTEQT